MEGFEIILLHLLITVVYICISCNFIILFVVFHSVNIMNLLCFTVNVPLGDHKEGKNPYRIEPNIFYEKQNPRARNLSNFN